MELIEINKNSNLINKIEKIYLSSFPADERMEFKDILDRKAPNSELFALCNDNKLVGFTFISSFGNFAYIIYLAIDEIERNKKYGSMALKLIDKKYKGKTKVLCVEKPLKKDDLKSKRIGFYKRNGFHLADFEFNYLGRVYYSMFSGNFDKEKFMELLLICFPGCRNFNNILDFDELDANNLKSAIKMQNNIFSLENGAEDLKESVKNRVPSHQIIQKYWLAKINNKFIGITGIYAYKIAPKDAWLGWFGVIQEERGNGYATQILDWTINKAKQLGFETIRLYTDEEDNAQAINLYKKRGFIGETYDNPEDMHFEISKTLIYSKNLIGEKTTLWGNKYLGLGAHDKKNEIK